MRRRLLRVMSKAYLSWLKREMEPSGKALLPLLEERMKLVIDAVPAEGGGSPSQEEMVRLDAESVKRSLFWLLGALADAYPDDWATLAVECLRVMLRRNIDDIVELGLPDCPEPLSKNS